MRCTVKNNTQFAISFTGSYFDSGRYWEAPKGIEPFSVGTFSICNKDGSIMTGATGGNSWSIDLGNNQAFKLALVWVLYLSCMACPLTDCFAGMDGSLVWRLQGCCSGSRIC